MIRVLGCIVSCVLLSARVAAANDRVLDAAAAFGARQGIWHMRLSPDGSHIAFLGATNGSGTRLYTLSLEKGAVVRPSLSSDGHPDRLEGCDWISDTRLVCRIYGILPSPRRPFLLPFARLIAIDADGTNPKILSIHSNEYARGYELGSGSIVDVPPEHGGTVLMARIYRPDDHLGTRLASSATGLGVDRLDTRTMAAQNIEQPRPEAFEYLSDGQGTVRIMGLTVRRGRGQDTGVLRYLYRGQGSRDWSPLSEFDVQNNAGFKPLAVDPKLNVAYGIQKKDGRLAIYSLALDGSLRETLVFARPDVDVDSLARIGRRERVVGVDYVTDRREVQYFDREIAKLHLALAKALPDTPDLTVVDSSEDESKLLVLAASDKDPGTYYLFDRKAAELRILMAVREPLLQVSLASVHPVHYQTADGTTVPAYLTLPAAKPDGKHLPAIVLPHGGPAARDQMEFNWLAQFFASQGFAVLQPNFRGSAGYGDAWFENNGFRSWQIAIGDVLDAGRWLVAQGIADPAKLAVVGWSYGGYASLQAAAVDPAVFKAVIAIAPVTDLNALKDESEYWSDHDFISRYVGSGPQLREGSPLQNASRIKVPVLLFHGALDLNVSIAESKAMASRLSAVSGHCELVTWDDLDHRLDDSQARTQMLRKSGDFLHQTLGL